MHHGFTDLQVVCFRGRAFGKHLILWWLDIAPQFHHQKHEIFRFEALTELVRRALVMMRMVPLSDG
jgi:hypothetical protein